jgi:hypothetical protein
VLENPLHWTGINPDDDAAPLHQLECEGTITTAQVEDALTPLRCEQINHCQTQVSNKPSVLGILLGIPVLIR